MHLDRPGALRYSDTPRFAGGHGAVNTAGPIQSETRHARAVLGARLREPAFSLILPTYNAGPFLDRTWEAIIQFLRQQAGDWEALFVCDGCSDGTTERLQTLVRSTTEPVGVLSYVPNLGKGYAVRCGLEQRTGSGGSSPTLT